MVTQRRKGNIVMAKLNKIQKYAVLWLHHQSKTTKEISDELELSEKQISGITSKSIENTGTVPTTKSSMSSSRSKNLMITETAGKKTRSVAIMTKEASMINDEYKNKSFPQQKNTDKYIYRPNK